MGEVCPAAETEEIQRPLWPLFDGRPSQCRGRSESEAGALHLFFDGAAAFQR